MHGFKSHLSFQTGVSFWEISYSGSLEWLKVGVQEFGYEYGERLRCPWIFFLRRTVFNHGGLFFQIPGAYVVPEDASTFLHLLCAISDVDWGLEDVGFENPWLLSWGFCFCLRGLRWRRGSWQKLGRQ